MIVAPVADKLVSAVTPPIAPVKVMVPAVPAFTVTAAAPFKVLEKLMFAPAGVPPAFVLSKVGVPLTTTGPVIVMTAPLVVIFPPTLIAVDPV